jgi:hypothetical protein
MRLALHIGGWVEARTRLGCPGHLGIELHHLPVSNDRGVVGRLVGTRRAHHHGLMSAVHNDTHRHRAAVYPPTTRSERILHVIES